MDVVKFIGKKTSPELAALAAEVMEHYKRREGETEEEFSHRLWHDMPQRKYAEMPIELQAWVDTFAPLEETRDFFRRCIPAAKWEELSADQMGLSVLLAEIPRKATWIIEASVKRSAETGEMLDVGIYPNLTGTALLQAWKDITGEDLFGDDDPGKPLAEALEGIERVTVSRADTLAYPLDKVNANIWSLLETDTHGQLRIGVEKQGSRKEINILYSINFDDLGENLRISKRLTQYDKRVYIAVAGLFNAGNDVITLHQVYTAMGGTGKPSDDQREKISTAIAKMQSAMISVDNSMEAAAYNYKKFVYSGYLLPIERVKKIVNGNLVEEAIHIFREPPVMTFARQRRQITTIPVRLLNSPISKTDANLAIEDYLLERISRAKDGHSPCKILYKTICDKAGAVTAKQRQRVPEKVERYLTHYAKEGFIASFKTAADGVTISF